MNKKETIKMAALYAGIPVKDEQKAVEAFLSAISDILSYKDEVVIPDFGKFTFSRHAARRYRNPHTGEMEMHKAVTKVKFKPYGNIFNYSRKYGH